MMMEQASSSHPIDSLADHRSDVSDANSVDSYVSARRLRRRRLIDVDTLSRAFSIDNGVVTTPESVEHSSSAATLLNELQKVKEDLKSKDVEIQRAHEMRQNTDREIEDLTASLFEVIPPVEPVANTRVCLQSAHSMVEQAKYAQANAEQKLRVANQTVSDPCPSPRTNE